MASSTCVLTIPIPPKEKVEFVDSIKKDIQWLGADWEDRPFFASDYFDQMYEYAVKLIKRERLSSATCPPRRSGSTGAP